MTSPTTGEGMPRAASVEPAPALAASERGTGVREAHARPEAIERGRQIAVSMMDRAEAKYRHANGTPHIREHCETCAEEYWANRDEEAGR
jgi:hypothetical protein